MDNFQSEPMPCSLDISVYAEVGAVKPLYCPIKLTGVTPPKTIYIDRPLPPSPANLPSSNS